MNISVLANYLKCRFGVAAKEEVGGAEIIATVLVIGVVIVLGVAFSSQIQSFFTDLWNNVVGANGTAASNAIKVG